MKIDEELIKRVIQPRQRHSHKGTYGRVLLIGGHYPYGGAIIMAALAAVSSGAGLVTVATDRDNIPALHSHLPEAMAFDLREKEGLLEQIKASDVILIGPGLGEDVLAQESLDLVLNQVTPEQVVIIDGSALNLLARKTWAELPGCQLVLTPHQKEWERLSGLPIAQQTAELNQAALASFAPGTVLVAKSQETAVYQGEEIAVLGNGGPYQATGGMGDTLAGMIAGFAAQFAKNSLYESVLVAAWLHSAIADDLSENAYVVLPTTISQAIPKWMKKWSH